MTIIADGSYGVFADKSGNSFTDPIADVERSGQKRKMSIPSKYAGMTVNERLFDARLSGAFDVATKSRDRAEMIRLLTKVEVDNAAWSVDILLANHRR
ncbi:hypothetical protein [Blastomonas fulva]|uniref:hypothetical protein n=1 Tax=Blastomonas fulva TaxID=1550728 RepID=UPI0025A32776|nr:hypothetical protein [Blastomonas fulva]MDM7967022.1 hypothetical protein [Blastomonas fulva]